jgi:energy-coupling factor transporter ATP-binding protein EcfA2
MAHRHLYVAHVRGTVKGGVDTALGPKTLIVGPNGSGKSRVVNALELALSGHASDVVGRPQMKSGPDLIALAPEDEPLHAVATLSDDRSASFCVERKAGGKTGRPEHAAIDGLHVVYPAPAVVAALRGNVQTARSFVLQHAGLDVTSAGLIAKIPEALRDDYIALSDAEDESVDPISGLIQARDGATKAAKKARADAKAAGALVDAAEDVAIPDADALDAAQVAVRDAAAAYEAARNLPEAVDLHALYAEAQAALGDLQRAEQAVAQLSQAAGEEIGGSEEAAKARHALQTLLTLTASHGSPHAATVPCVLCGQTTTVDPADYRARAAALVQAGEREQTVMEARRRLPDVQQAAQRAQQHAERLVAAYREAHAAQTGSEASQDRNGAIQAAYAALTQAEATLRTMQQAQARAEEIDRVVQQQENLRVAASRMDDLATVCGDLADDLVKDARIGFVSRVQGFLPDGDTFDLVLRQNKRDVCMFGLIRDGVLHTALSGAEWSRLTLALGAACIPTDADVLAVLTPEERAYDGVTLASVMRALSQAPGQVILTSPIKPRGRTPAGWTVLDAGAAAEGGTDA